VASAQGTPARYVNTGADIGQPYTGSIEVKDDRDAIKLGHRTVLIIEDDATFAAILLELAREKQFKGVVTTEGAGTLALTKKFRPDVIMLDLGLTDIDGRAVLDMLKHDVYTRHIPVHVISGLDGIARAHARRLCRHGEARQPSSHRRGARRRPRAGGAAPAPGRPCRPRRRAAPEDGRVHRRR
jgi:CheY-like chemotaxis protein